MKPTLTAFVFIFALCSASSAPWAYSVNSNFGDPCHEQLVLEAYLNFAVDLSTDNVPIPKSKAWRKISEQLLGVNNLSALDEGQELIITSLIIGVRSPDTNGHGLFDFDSLRALHAAPDGQYIHALRAIDDNGPEGDVRAIEGIRQEILASMRKAQEFSLLPPEQQIIEVDLYVDFYGLIKIEVWAPPFYLGKAMHTLQDSFSHTIRSDDLQQIRHVMNYVDAIGNSFEEKTDGMAHSDSMDKCVGETAPVYNAAREATIALFLATFEVDEAGNNEAAITRVLDKWLTHEPGCTQTNNYCDSKWVPIARLEPTGPYIETILGCNAVVPSSPSRGSGWIFGLALMVAVLCVGRRS